MDTRLAQDIKTVVFITFISTLIGGFFGLIREAYEIRAITSSTFMGFSISLGITCSEVFLFQKTAKRMQFTIAIIIRTIFYTVIIIFFVILSGLLFGYYSLEKNILQFLIENNFGQIILFSFVLTFIFVFTSQINRLIGRRVLGSFFTGRYHRPREEDRIFMFLDLKSSTTIAEKLGHVRFHRFVNDFFYTITAVILKNKGEIYKYVGDEVILSWRPKEGLEDARCIKFFFDAIDSIEGDIKAFTKEYGTVPEFKAGLHLGKVVAGEMGDIKQEIAFLGDTVNTTARIEAECNKMNKSFIVSQEVLAKVKLPEDYKAQDLGEINLRGKEKGIKLYAIER